VYTRHLQHTTLTWRVAADALIARGETALGERIKRLVEGEPDDRNILLGFYDWEYPLVYDTIFEEGAGR
jgi:hypothetical protein